MNLPQLSLQTVRELISFNIPFLERRVQANTEAGTISRVSGFWAMTAQNLYYRCMSTPSEVDKYAREYTNAVISATGNTAGVSVDIAIVCAIVCAGVGAVAYCWC